MQLKSNLLVATILLAPLLCAGTAVAQLDPNADVSVNPSAGGRVLLYPGGQYQRVVTPLLQPGDPYPGVLLEPVHLHKPIHHHVVHIAPTTTSVANAAPTESAAPQTAPTDTAPPPETSTAPAPAPTPPPPNPSRHKHGTPSQLATTAPSTDASIPFSMDPDAIPIAPSQPANSAPATPPPKAAAVVASPAPAPVTKTPPPPAMPAQPVRQASLEKSDSGEHASLTKRGAVLFDKGAADPSPAQYHGVQVLAGALNSALESGATRIELDAYGGMPGDKSSDARRLSLKRALAVRQLLIDDGVPSSRIDVRAMGGASDNGPTDRVDVFIHAG